MSHLKIDKL
ncbi:odorant binding protein [Diachasma alloeum]|uniref:Odorant binding protein n=1 Tax=Diachasma alloeum TaxID=454923 RepID=A0A4E0RLR2_9HYME|nr:odorant binding protein [Diachasma alloeum]